MTITRTPRRTKSAPKTTPELVSISNICKAQNITEQSFRLALMEIRPDDFDSIKSIPQPQIDQVLATLTSAVKELPSQATAPETPETLTPQEIQTATETAPQAVDKPQNSGIVPSAPNQLTRTANAARTPDVLGELVATAKEETQLADLVLQFRNQQITQNQQARDGELITQLREQRQNTRNQVFDALRGFGGVVDPVDIQELDSLENEINQLTQELGKELILVD